MIGWYYKHGRLWYVLDGFFTRASFNVCHSQLCGIMDFLNSGMDFLNGGIYSALYASYLTEITEKIQ